jgi:CubicO group peptidase (beta-lactamase class C family)
VQRIGGKRKIVRQIFAAFAAMGIAACATPSLTSQAVSANVDPAASWNAAALADVTSYVQSQKTSGFLIIHDKRVIAGHNWPLGDDAAIFKTNFVHGVAPDGALLEDVASQQKSFIAILVGVAVDKGLLDISKPVSAYAGAGWSKAAPQQEAKIAVRNLLEMNSGLKENLTFEAAPDTKFFYNTPAYAVLKRVLEGASKQPLDDLTRLWLTEPAGMKDTAWRKRPGAFADVGNPTGLVTTPRDIARMGQLVLDEGVAPDGKRIISKTGLAAMFKPTATNPAYGRLWWLNGQTGLTTAAGAGPAGELIPAAPDDLVAAQGAQDRKLYVVPSRKLIVVRTGQATPDRDFNQQLWIRLMKAAPAH